MPFFFMGKDSVPPLSSYAIFLVDRDSVPSLFTMRYFFCGSGLCPSPFQVYTPAGNCCEINSDNIIYVTETRFRRKIIATNVFTCNFLNHKRIREM